MKKPIACVSALSTFAAAPGLLVSSANAQVNCGPDAPASHLRPGGFCDNATSGKSLTGPNNEGCDTSGFTFPDFFFLNYKGGDESARLQLVADCTVDCGVYYETIDFPDVFPEGMRVHLAQSGIPEGCQLAG